MLPGAFRASRIPFENDAKKSWWSEGEESLDEQILRERKDSLSQLFSAVNLKPICMNSSLHSASSRTTEAFQSTSSANKGNVKATEVIGDDEDAEEVEIEGEELDIQHISIIYKKLAFGLNSSCGCLLTISQGSAK
jgi:DNA repair protein RAD5